LNDILGYAEQMKVLTTFQTIRKDQEIKEKLEYFKNQMTSAVRDFKVSGRLQKDSKDIYIGAADIEHG
jgi:hypothetical protein